MLVESPLYHPWVCECLATRQIAAFSFGFLTVAGGRIVSMAGGRTRLEHRRSGLINALTLHTVSQALESRLSPPPAFLGVYCQPHYLTDTIGKYIKGRVVLLHSCLAFELSPSLRRQLKADAAVAAEEVASVSGSDVFAEVASPEAFLAAETADSASGIGLGPGDYMVLLREAAIACPEALARMRHWTVDMLASRRGSSAGTTLSGVSFANGYPCPVGVNLVLNIYARDEAAASGHIVEQLRRYLLRQTSSSSSASDVPDVDRTVFVSAYFAHSLSLNDILSRLHLTRWLGAGRLPLSNFPNAICTLRVTRTELGNLASEAASAVGVKL